jgi:hypothetical protein
MAPGDFSGFYFLGARAAPDKTNFSLQKGWLYQRGTAILTYFIVKSLVSLTLTQPEFTV